MFPRIQIFRYIPQVLKSFGKLFIWEIIPADRKTFGYHDSTFAIHRHMILSSSDLFQHISFFFYLCSDPLTLETLDAIVRFSGAAVSNQCLELVLDRLTLRTDES